MGARAATIEVTPIGQGDLSIVTVKGELVYDDIEQFRAKTSMLPKAFVLFGSDGGNLAAGIEIGTTIRLKGYVSLVPDGVRCASACALAWLGGHKRFMGATALIGFHAASIQKDGVTSETSVGNALVGSYLNRIGLPDRAVVYITAAAPDEITWLKLSDAAELGIDVELFTPPENAQQTGPTKPDPWQRSAPDSPAPSPPDYGLSTTAPQNRPASPQFATGPNTTQPPGTAPPETLQPSKPIDLGALPVEVLNLLDLADATFVQERLRTLGYLEYPPDGIWGAGSRAALRDFRRTRSLGNDDRWDAGDSIRLNG